ncbi:MAG: hypothetical protein HXS46_03885 [Theionarchaea archaeon]|nr:MAG: hypothetical protein AYK18_16265 [Theionarchaea archaeon DG-70]MBU7009804.1 hypothetical protein [Theionarchaea archaeon]
MEHEKIDFLVFPHVEELDVIGPFEVFGKINDVTAHHCELRILAPQISQCAPTVSTLCEPAP